MLTVPSTAAPVGAVGEMETRVTGRNSNDRQNGEDHDNDSNDDHDDYFHDILPAHDVLVSIEFPLRVCYANAHMAQLYTRSCSFTTAL